MIEVTVQAKDVEECLRQLGQVILAMISDEDIIREARNRAHKQGLVIDIDMPEATPTIKVGPKQGNSIEAVLPKAEDEEPKRRGPGRPPKVAEAAPTVVKSEVADTLTASGGFPAREANEGGRAGAKGNGSPPTQQQVIDALNAYAATHGGPVSGRQVMKDVCGVTRLVDCNVADYPRLLAALGA